MYIINHTITESLTYKLTIPSGTISKQIVEQTQCPSYRKNILHRGVGRKMPMQWQNRKKNMYKNTFL